MTPSQFRRIVWSHFKKEGRHDLPWRQTTDSYRILVSEIMLQQTQVERVVPYYTKFLETFPTAEALAKAPLSEVLTLWQGLGYNRRARMLHEAAKAAVEDFDGKVPATEEALLTLPGVGPYTAGAVAAFAGNQDSIFIETNIRTAVLHNFFEDAKEVPDADIKVILEKAYPKGRAREWYSALMDYGSSLKRAGVKRNSQVKGYVSQKAFKGSDREARGAILRALVEGSCGNAMLLELLGHERREQMALQLEKLRVEGLVKREGLVYRLPD